MTHLAFEHLAFVQSIEKHQEYIVYPRHVGVALIMKVSLYRNNSKEMSGLYKRLIYG